MGVKQEGHFADVKTKGTLNANFVVIFAFLEFGFL